MGYDELSDEELILAVPTSAEAFDAIYLRYVERVIVFLAGRCHSP